jgi:FecR protein
MVCHMKRLIIVSFFLAQFVTFLSPSSQTFAADNPVGKIIGLTGTIEYLSSGSEPVAQAKPGEVKRVSFEKWEKVKFHQAVYPKDKFRTSRKSRLKILLADNSLIALGPNSEVKVESYLFSKKDKLRQGVIGMANGLFMYIVNKSQTNKKSSFRIVTPTANIAARGTQGYTSSSQVNTYVANRVGCVDDYNIDPEIKGVVQLCANMGNNIPKDGPPTPAKALDEESVDQINTMVLGLAAINPGERGDFTDSFLATSEADLAEFFEENNPFSVETNVCNN